MATETKTIVIQGVEFAAPLRFAEGHTLTTVEARALNQVYHENLRNNFAKTVKATQAGEDGAVPLDGLQKAFDEYASAYDFSMPGSGGGTRSLDPIEREARSLARDLIRSALAKQGKSMTAPRDASDEEKATYKASIDAKVEEIAGREEVLKRARKNVEDRKKSLDSIAEGLNL